VVPVVTIPKNIESDTEPAFPRTRHLPPTIEADNAPGRKRTAFTSRNYAAPLLGTLGVFIVFAAGELVVRAGLVSQDDVPKPSSVVAELVRQMATGNFWGLVYHTMQGWAIGLAIALLAIPVGMAVGSNDMLWHAFRPTIEFLRPVPGVALVPLTILVYGTGLTGKVFLVTFGATWILLVQSMYGAREADPVARDTVRTFGLNWWERVRFLSVPSALPFVATGLRIASAVALIVGVTAELVIGSAGLGSSIAMAEQVGDTTLMCALILASGFVGVVIHLVFSALEHRLLHWHVSQRKDGGQL
jgi:ABC-type nitrate/sulfonate/bicarbonate transport system permease component